METIKITNNSPVILSKIFSFLNYKKILEVIWISKKFQSILSIPKDAFKLRYIMKKEIENNNNMGSYFEYFCYKYPNIKPNIIKELFIDYLKEFSKEKKIKITSKHHLSKDIIKAIIDSKIILNISSDHFSKDDFCVDNYPSIYKVEVERNIKIKGVKCISDFFDKCMNQSVKKLKFYSLQNYEADEINCFIKKISEFPNLLKFSTDCFIGIGKMSKIISKLQKLEYVDFSIDEGENYNFKEDITTHPHLRGINFELRKEMYNITSVLGLLEGKESQLKKLCLFEVKNNIQFNLSQFDNLQNLRLLYLSEDITTELTCHQLKKINIFYTKIKIDALIKTLENNTKLEDININFIYIETSDDDKQKFASTLGNLKCLKKLNISIENADKITSNLHSESLENISLTIEKDFNVSLLTNGCPKLNAIEIILGGDDEYVPEGEEPRFNLNFPPNLELKYLSLLNLRYLSETDIKNISTYSKLTVLKIHDLIVPPTFMNNFGENILKMKNLKGLTLMIDVPDQQEQFQSLKFFWKLILTNIDTFERIEFIEFPNAKENIDYHTFEEFCIKAQNLKLLNTLTLNIAIDKESIMKILNKYRNNFINLCELGTVLYDLAEVNESNSPVLKEFIEKYGEMFMGNLV